MRPSRLRASIGLRKSLRRKPAAWTPYVITSRVDGIDADVPRPQLGGERCCGRIHCSLRGIPHAARELETDIDDAPAGGIEMLRGRLRGQDQAEDMGVQMPPKCSSLRALKRPKLVDSRISHQDVDPAEPIFRLGKTAARHRFSGHIRLDRDRLATILFVISVTSRSPSSLWDASLTTTDAPSTARYWAIALQSPRSRPSPWLPCLKPPHSCDSLIPCFDNYP